MKSQFVAMLLEVAHCVFDDICVAYPQDGSFFRDKDRLSRLVEDRGIGVFQFDLPELDQALLQGLELGLLSYSGPVSRLVSNKIQVPRFLSGLWLRVFDKTGVLLPEVDVNAILFIRQIANLFKKLEIPCSPSRMKDAVDEYRTVDQSLRKPSLDWLSDSFSSSRECLGVHFCDALAPDHGQQDLPFTGFDRVAHDSGDEELLRNLQRTADSFAGYLDQFNAISASCTATNRRGSGRGVKHGPGAIARKTGVVDKFDFPYAPRKLSRVFPQILMYPEGRALHRGVGLNHEVPSRLIAVPKTAKAPRLIAAEPEEHQWFQQLMLDWFNYQFSIKLPDFINLRDQAASQEAARHGSLTGKTASVDLSSASDRLSCWVVERIFRSNYSVLSALQSCRTRWIRNQIPGTSPYNLILRKYASQGTACTFPVQTFCFLVMVFSVLRGSTLEDKIRMNKGMVRVYGDDIIVPTYGYARLCRLFDLLQLKVNQSKSFSKGDFRESCGGDFYKGFNVTPTKPTSIDATGPDCRISLLDTSNNFFKSGFWLTAEKFGCLLPRHVRKNLPVVSLHSGTTGLTSFCGSWYAHLPLRWDSALQIVRYRVWDVKSRPSKIDRSGRNRLRKFLLENPIRGIMDTSPYDSDLLLRARPGDGLSWRALEPYSGFRANPSF